MHGEHHLACIRSRNPNTQIFIGFDNKIGIYLILQKNVKFENMIFKMKMIFTK